MTGFWQPAFLGFASRIKMFEKIGKFALTSAFGLWLCCATVGLLGTEERRIWKSLWVFTGFSLFIRWEKVSPMYSAQAVLLLWSLWSVRSFSIPYAALCSFPYHTVNVDVTADHLCRNTEEQQCAHPNIHTENRYQCVTKERFLSSSKVCSKSFGKILSGLFFLYSNVLLGSSWFCNYFIPFPSREKGNKD